MAPRPTATAEILEIRAIDDVLAAEIDYLASHAAEPNPFYESWCLRAALASLPVERLQLLAVRSGSGELILIMPLARHKRFKQLPMRNLRSWSHDYAFLATPLVSQARLPEAIDAALDWFASRQARAAVIELVTMRMDGVVAAALDDGLTHRPRLLARRTRWTRALHRLHEPDDPQHMSAKQRSTLRRKERRLGDEGSISYRLLGARDDVTPWIESFLEVEASGWKGRAGTAMAASESARTFFVAACRAAHARQQLHMLALELDGKPIAMKCNFLSGTHAFTFKIAYDEAHARYSPGILIELFQMQHIRDTHPHLIAVDSCTVADNTMFPNLWPDECVLGDYAILRNNFGTRALLRHGERLRHLLRRDGARP